MARCKVSNPMKVMQASQIIFAGLLQGLRNTQPWTSLLDPRHADLWGDCVARQKRIIYSASWRRLSPEARAVSEEL
jgi:hypothetical protein